MPCNSPGLTCLPPCDLPNRAVVECELIDLPGANAINTAVADVCDPGAFGTEQQGTRRRAESPELRVFLPDGENAGIGFYERALEALSGPSATCL